jgi:glyceraldehyde 3-phosphate dehydrogenase (phosphorylating)
VFGRYAGDIKATAGELLVDGDLIRLFAEREPARLPWSDLDIDVVVEITGKFTSRDKAAAHLEAVRSGW